MEFTTSSTGPATGFFTSKSNGFLGNAGDFAHAEANAHQLGTETHDARHQAGKKAATALLASAMAASAPGKRQ